MRHGFATQGSWGEVLLRPSVFRSLRKCGPRLVQRKNGEPYELLKTCEFLAESPHDKQDFFLFRPWGSLGHAAQPGRAHLAQAAIRRRRMEAWVRGSLIAQAPAGRSSDAVSAARRASVGGSAPRPRVPLGRLSASSLHPGLEERARFGAANAYKMRGGPKQALNEREVPT